jgi:hypothetical protein
MLLALGLAQVEVSEEEEQCHLHSGKELKGEKVN